MSEPGAPEKPLLLVDVDGALSPAEMPDDPGVIWGCSRIFGFEMPLHPNLRAWLRRLAEEYEPVWCSTWGAEGLAELAVHLSLPSGMPRIPIGADSDVHPTETAEDAQTTKLFYVDHWLTANGLADRQLAWFDDRLEVDAFIWAEERAAPTLLVCTDPAYGITAVEVERMEMFALGPQLVKEPA